MSFLGMDIGWGELLIILIVGLLVVGPDKLPMYARKTAKFVRNFQKVTTNLTGQISKAMNLEDEDEGKASNFKKDLIEVKKSLEKDVADLKATLDSQTRAVNETMEKGTKEAAAQLEKNAREISDSLNTGAGELKTSLEAQAKAVADSMEAGAKEATAQLEKNAAEISAAAAGVPPPTIEGPKDAPIATPISKVKPAVPVPPPGEAE